VIYVNGQASGPFWPWEQITRLIQAATDARVSIDTIQTGGWIIDANIGSNLDPPPSPARQLAAPTSPNGAEEVSVAPRIPRAGDGQGAPGATPRAPSASLGGGGGALRGVAGLYDLRHVAGMTGGQSSLNDLGDKSLARIDAATRAHYLLAYYPSNGNWDGRYRSIRVTVDTDAIALNMLDRFRAAYGREPTDAERAGIAADARHVTVLFRHGYTAQQKIDTFDRRAFLVDSRLTAAGYALTDIRDIGVKVTPVFTKSATGRGGDVLVKIVVDASRLAFAINDLDRHEARLDVAVYCGDAGQTIVGQTRQVIDLNLTDATYERFMKGGIPHETRIPVTKAPRFVKVVVLDFEASLTGSAMVVMK